jgi:hypothetical protein
VPDAAVDFNTNNRGQNRKTKPRSNAGKCFRDGVELRFPIAAHGNNHVVLSR